MGLPILAPPGSTPDQRIAALEKAIMQVAQVANGALQIAPNQRSAVLGELIASRITTPLPAGQPSMALDMIQTAPGKGPILRVNDGTYDRAQAGSLAAYTGPNGVSSPAQYGFRALDQNGNNIFDSLGLINTMTSLGFKAGPSSDAVATANTSTWADFGVDTEFTITVSGRPQRILYFVYAAAKTAGAGGQVAYIRGNIVGFDTSASPVWDKANPGWSNGFMPYFAGPGGSFATIPVGTYTVKLQGATDNGQTVTLLQFFHMVFQTGS